jgi:hypothetical protein
MPGAVGLLRLRRGATSDFVSFVPLWCVFLEGQATGQPMEARPIAAPFAFLSQRHTRHRRPVAANVV